MKILSKYKDFYDFLSGIWGEDPKLVLDRREFHHPDFYPQSAEHIKLYICGKIIQGFWDGQNFYFGESLSKFGEIKEPRQRHWFFNPENENGRYVRFDFAPDHPYSMRNSYEIIIDPIDDKKGVNIKENCPILMSNRYSRDGYHKYPILSKMNVGSVLSPEVIYKMLVDWLSERNNEAEYRPDNRNDVEKLISKGFDKKHSFRKT